MMEREMTTDEKIDFVRKSAEMRFSKEKVLNDMEIVGLLSPNVQKMKVTICGKYST
jgi:hypothetical protein